MARSPEQIRAQLEQAREAEKAASETFYTALSNAGGAPGQRAALEAARLAIGSLYRELAKATGDEYVIPLSLGFHPEAAVSGAFLIQDENRSFLTFNATRIAEDGRSASCGTAVIELHGALSTKFGLPNDETLPGHPLYERGLNFYSIGEVLNSSWAREAERQNRVSFPADEPWEIRHFIFTFHDSSFECLASDLTYELSSLSHSEILSSLYSKLDSYE